MSNPDSITLLAGESITVGADGAATVVNACSTITADNFPLSYRPFTVFCRCRFTAAGRAQVTVEAPDGATLLALEPIRMTGPGDAQQVHTITGLVFPAAGDYRITVTGAQGALASIPLAVRLRS